MATTLLAGLASFLPSCAAPSSISYFEIVRRDQGGNKTAKPGTELDIVTRPIYAEPEEGNALVNFIPGPSFLVNTMSAVGNKVEQEARTNSNPLSLILEVTLGAAQAIVFEGSAQLLGEAAELLSFGQWSLGGPVVFPWTETSLEKPGQAPVVEQRRPQGGQQGLPAVTPVEIRPGENVVNPGQPIPVKKD